MKKLSITIFLIILVISFSRAQSIVGKWKTIDDETGKPRSVVQLYENGGKIYGKILQLYREKGEDMDPICDKCSGDKKNKKILGMVFVNALEQDDDEWEDGTILDPKNGKTYSCKMWLEDGNLKVRGYIGPFFRTQTWFRVN